MKKKRIVSVLLVMVLFFGCLSNKDISFASTTVKPIVRITHPEMNTIKLTWEPVANAIGYNIYMSTSNNGTLDFVTTVFGTSFVASKLQENQKYYFKVVPYTVEGSGIVEGVASDIIAETSNRLGIDVSKWQRIDWAKLKAESDVQFAMIRLGTSSTSNGFTQVLDTYFDRNIKGATAQGFRCGIYFYSKATTEKQAIQEANYVISKMKNYSINYPIAFDIEDSVHKKLSRAQNSKIVLAFCDTIKKAGYEPLIYTYYSFINSYLNYSTISKYDLWLARYNNVLGYAHPVRMWQFSSSAVLPGITKNTVDVNYEYDYKEPINGSTVYHADEKVCKYHAKAGDTIASIAAQYNMTIAEFLTCNPNYTETSAVKEGDQFSVGTVNQTILTVSNPTGVMAKAVNAKNIKVSWSTVPSATGYTIYRSTSHNSGYKELYTTKKTSYEDKNVSVGTTYYYKVVAFRESAQGILYSGESSVVSAKTKLSKTTGVKATSASYTSAKVTWKKTTGATGYYVYRATSKKGSYKKIATTKSTSYTNKKLSFNKTYYYKIVAYYKGKDKTQKASASSIVSVKTILPKTSIKSVKKGSKRLIISWNKVTGAQGYQVYRSTKKSGSYKRIKAVKGTSFTNISLKSKKTYYYKVRAYRKVNGKYIYSKFSSIKSNKTK